MFPSRPKRTAATREDFLRQASEVRESRLGDTNRTVAAKRIQVRTVRSLILSLGLLKAMATRLAVLLLKPSRVCVYVS